MRTFTEVGAAKVRRSMFDLSHVWTSDIDMCTLYPCWVEDCLPGDYFKISQDVVVRAHQALIAPLAHNVHADVHYFVIPKRIMWSDDNLWSYSDHDIDDADIELYPQSRIGDFHAHKSQISRACPGSFIKYMTKGISGKQDLTPPNTIHFNVGVGLTGAKRIGRGSLLDFLYGVAGITPASQTNPPLKDSPSALPLVAYNFVFNEVYRDEACQQFAHPTWGWCPVSPSLTQAGSWYDPLYGDPTDAYYSLYSISSAGVPLTGSLLPRNLEKDYFTIARPFQQRGTAPAFELSGVAPVNYTDPTQFTNGALGYVPTSWNPLTYPPIDRPATYISPTATGSFAASIRVGKANSAANSAVLAFSPTAVQFPSTYFLTPGYDDHYTNAGAVSWDYHRHALPNPDATVPIGPSLVTFGTKELREVVQTQMWLERNARAGVRWADVMVSHWGTPIRDDLNNRPEYIGGSRVPVIFSEVSKTTGDAGGPATSKGSQQGYPAGRGLGASRDFVCKVHIKEPSILMAIISILPETMYSQGIRREWLRTDAFDEPWPEFCHLSERPVWQQEIYYDFASVDTRKAVFGYQGMYDEYRYRKSEVHGSLAPSGKSSVNQGLGPLSFWTLSRMFTSAPTLASSMFMPLEESRLIFPVRNAPPFIATVGFQVSAARPLPQVAEPGLMDHS